MKNAQNTLEELLEQELFLTLAKGTLEQVDGLIADGSIDPQSAFEIASYFGRADIMETLLINGQVDPTFDSNSAIKWACQSGHVEAARVLLNWKGKNGAYVDPTIDDNFAIIWATRNGHTDIVDLLHSWRGPKDERIDYFDRDLFESTARTGFKDTALKLWDEGLRLTQEKQNDHILFPIKERYDGTREENRKRFIKAMYINDVDEVKALLKSSVGVDATIAERKCENTNARYNNYAIKWACLEGHADIVEALLKWRGPNGEHVDPTADNNHAFKMAAMKQNIPVMRLLLEWKSLDGKCVDPTDDDNYVIWSAANNGHKDVVKLLAAAGVPIPQEAIDKGIIKADDIDGVSRKLIYSDPTYSTSIANNNPKWLMSELVSQYDLKGIVQTYSAQFTLTIKDQLDIIPAIRPDQQGAIKGEALAQLGVLDRSTLTSSTKGSLTEPNKSWRERFMDRLKDEDKLKEVNEMKKDIASTRPESVKCAFEQKHNESDKWCVNILPRGNNHSHSK